MGEPACTWQHADGTTFYASNAGSGTLSAYGDDGSGTLRAAGTTATGAGTVDAAVSGDGRYLYIQAGAGRQCWWGRGRHLFRPVPLRYVITRSGQVQAAPQGWPNRSRGVFAVDSHDRSRT